MANLGEMAFYVLVADVRELHEQSHFYEVVEKAVVVVEKVVVVVTAKAVAMKVAAVEVVVDQERVVVVVTAAAVREVVRVAVQDVEWEVLVHSQE